MGNVIMYDKQGSRLNLLTSSNAGMITSAEQVKELNGQDVIELTITSCRPIEFKIGYYMEFKGERYTINTPPVEEKKNDRLFEYTVKLEGIQYEFIKAQYIDVDASGYATGTDFYLTGTLDMFCNVLIRNVNRVSNFRFELGEYPLNTEAMNLQFTEQTCLAALQSICEEYDMEYHFERLGLTDFKLHIFNSEDVAPDIFKYGRCRGLYELRKTAFDDSSLITRLYAYGSGRNILPTYRGGSPRLKLPFYAIPSESFPYIENTQAVAEYGVVEASVTYEDIYPSRTGTVTSISASNELEFVDNSMPFDLNATDGQGNTLYLISGQNATINFKTGNLAGYEFNIEDYDHITRKFTIQTYTDNTGRNFPSAPLNIQVGDEYTILGINLPQSYLDEAEERLYEKALDFLAQNSSARYKWELNVDRDFIKSKNVDHYFKLGQWIRVQDDDLAIDTKSKVQGIKRQVLDPDVYSITLGEAKKYSQLRKKANYLYNISRGNGDRTSVFSASNRGSIAIQQIATQTFNQNIQNVSNSAIWTDLLW